MEITNSNIIPFKVSARTARLIGRENIATSKGAIIELVKNGYDADSKTSIVYFDNKYSTLQNEISDEVYNDFIRCGIQKGLLNEVYEKQNDIYTIKEKIDDGIKIELRKSISKLSCLYIIDFGEGMTDKIIKDHWMTIGTDNKANDIFTNSGRIKAGAKGIGRFALDKLGSKCEMVTIFNPEKHDVIKDDSSIYNGFNWSVNWEDFEGEFKTIDKVGAILTGINAEYLKDEVLERLPDLDLSKIKSEHDFKYGTMLKVSDLRENWEDYFVDQVFSDLEVLVPPKEGEGFEIFVYSSLYPNKYGEVLKRVGELKKTGSRVTFVVAKLQGNDQTVY